jgi:dipeptidyl aminopeptidase/acylaminoacyl peptidase
MEAKRIWVALAFSSIVSLHAAALRAADIPPVEAFGSLPQVSDVELSPDGSLIAFSEARPQGSFVVMHDLQARKDRRTIPVLPPYKLQSITWADNETLLVTLSSAASYYGDRPGNKYEVERTYAADVAGGKDRMLLMGGGERDLVLGADLLAWRTATPKTVVMSTWDYARTQARQQTGSRLAGGRKDSGWVSQVFEVDVRTGKGSRIAMGSQFTRRWIVDKNGNPVARTEWVPKTEVFTLVAKSGMGWKEIYRLERRGRPAVHGLTADGTAVILSSTKGERDGLRAYPLDGSASKLLIEDAETNVYGIVRDRITGTPVLAVLGGLEQSERWMDKDAERDFRRVAGAFPGKRVHVYGRSEDGTRVLAYVESPSSPPVYYFVDFKTNRADIVGEMYPKLADAKLGEVRAMHYKARDGAMVPAYLTLPPGSDGKNLPLVLLPHGGPEARDDYSFNWWAQFLAVRGYAVLQPQFRGSTGFGDAWQAAGYRQWGKLMQDDLTDGVKALIEQGVADASRVCIVGASYGGYAALAGAAFTPDLYKCAVSVNGVSDLPRMLTYERVHAGEESTTLADWNDHIGLSTDADVIAKSPLRFPEQFKAPVLLMHAADDTIVPIAQSETMSRALETARKKVTFVRLAGEDHHLSQTATRVQMLKELETFLATHLRKE